MAVSNTHTYRGISEITFVSEGDKGLFVTIDTERLHIRSVKATRADHDRYAALFGDKDVMEKFATGLTTPRDEVCRSIDDFWTKRWRERDPYSGLAVFRNDTDDFLGHVVLGHGNAPGEAELAYLFHRAHWANGYGSEAVEALVKEYAPATVTEGYTLEGKPLERIIATTRSDNTASLRILARMGMHFVCTREEYKALRNHYSMSLSEA